MEGAKSTAMIKTKTNDKDNNAKRNNVYNTYKIK